MDEEDDPVVQEIPVFLSQALAENLYIYQYPGKPLNRDWNSVKIVNAAIKPKNQLVRLELGLDTYSDTYNSSKGEQIALNTDGQQESRYTRDRERDRGSYFKSGQMDKLVLESSRPDTDCRYAVALLQDRELHCTPVRGIVQLRPSFSYFDKQDKRRKESDSADKSDDDDEPEAQQVTVKFARQETEVAKKAREKSFEHLSRRLLEEPWHAAGWSHADSDSADLERLKLFSGNTLPGAALALRAGEYVRALVPPPPPDEEGGGEAGAGAGGAEEGGGAAGAGAGAALEAELRELLISAKLLTFAEIRSLTRAHSDAAVLGALGACGVSVRGLWTARSADVYPAPAPAAPGGSVGGAGAAARLACAARDHVLYLFTQRARVEPARVAASVRLPPPAVTDVLRGVARPAGGAGGAGGGGAGGWELLLPPDTEFEARHPEIVQRYTMYFEGRQRLFNEMLLSENVPKRQRKKSQRESVSEAASPRVKSNSVCDEDDRRRRPRGKRARNASSGSAHDT